MVVRDYFTGKVGSVVLIWYRYVLGIGIINWFLSSFGQKVPWSFCPVFMSVATSHVLSFLVNWKTNLQPSPFLSPLTLRVTLWPSLKTNTLSSVMCVVPQEQHDPVSADVKGRHNNRITMSRLSTIVQLRFFPVVLNVF